MKKLQKRAKIVSSNSLKKKSKPIKKKTIGHEAKGRMSDQLKKKFYIFVALHISQYPISVAHIPYGLYQKQSIFLLRKRSRQLVRVSFKSVIGIASKRGDCSLIQELKKRIKKLFKTLQGLLKLAREYINQLRTRLNQESFILNDQEKELLKQMVQYDFEKLQTGQFEAQIENLFNDTNNSKVEWPRESMNELLITYKDFFDSYSFDQSINDAKSEMNNQSHSQVFYQNSWMNLNQSQSLNTIQRRRGRKRRVG